MEFFVVRNKYGRRPAFSTSNDVRGAVRAITSDSSYVVPETNSYEALLIKHPPLFLDRRPAPPIAACKTSYTVQQLLVALKSFSPGSAPGLDGLR